MEWSDHDEWAGKAGVPEEVSREVNAIVDAIAGRSGVPQEYKDELDQIRSEVLDEKEVARSGTVVEAVFALDDGHDSARKGRSSAKVHAEVQKRFMTRHGGDYLTAWYLHHYLDFLHEEKDSGKSLEELLSDFEKEKPQIHAEPVDDFLREHEEDLHQDLGI